MSYKKGSEEPSSVSCLCSGWVVKSKYRWAASYMSQKIYETGKKKSEQPRATGWERVPRLKARLVE